MALDPHDPEAIVTVITDTAVRASLMAAGLKLAAELRSSPPDPGPLFEALR